jgi:hypothetical protein
MRISTTKNAHGWRWRNCTFSFREERERERRMGILREESCGEASWHIYAGEIPYADGGDFWVSFESTPNLEKTKADIYGRCVPCIQHLYEQLKDGSTRIHLGPAFHCWKVTAILNGIEECLSLLALYEEKFPGGHVHGKFGGSRAFSGTKVVVFHTEEEKTRDLIRERIEACLPEVNRSGRVEVSRACAVLYADILGDWREWQRVTPLKHPEKVNALIQRIRKALFWASL